MARFSVGKEEDGCEAEPSSHQRPFPKKRRILTLRQKEQQHSICVEFTDSGSDSDSDSESEDEDKGRTIRENLDHDSEGSTQNGSVVVTLSDPDVLDCPICYESLTIPVFQCQNGHIACLPCCIKIFLKCSVCTFPIGFNRCRAIENVLESVKVSCGNMKYGCKEILSYSRKTNHEGTCSYTPCSCPHPDCDFVSTSTNLYVHFSDKHGSSAKSILFNTLQPIVIEKHQNYQILQEWSEGIIFIINHSTNRLGSAVNLICVGPTSSRRSFPYELAATDGEDFIKLNSAAESIPKWSGNFPMRTFLLVPRDVVNSSEQLMLDLFIKKE